MAKTLNFNSIKKQYLTVTLPDAKKTTVMIGTPTKAILTEFINMSESLTDATEQDQIMDELYKVCAKIMNRNKGGVVITAELLEECLDFEDIMIFINSYSEFIKEITSSKN